MNVDLEKDLALFQSEINRLRSAVEHIDASKTAAREAVDALGEIRNTFDTYARRVYATLNQQLSQFERPLADYRDLARKAHTLTGKLDSVHFPERLDKIEAVVHEVVTQSQSLEQQISEQVDRLNILYNNLAAQSGTLDVVMRSMRDLSNSLDITNILQQGLTPVHASTANILNSQTREAQDTKVKIAKLNKDAEQIKNATDGLAKLIHDLSASVNKTKDTVDGIMSRLNKHAAELSSGLEKLGKAIRSDQSESFGKAERQLADFQTTLQNWMQEEKAEYLAKTEAFKTELQAYIGRERQEMQHSLRKRQWLLFILLAVLAIGNICLATAILLDSAP